MVGAKKPEEIETEPDAWERFEKIISKIVPPKHRADNAALAAYRSRLNSGGAA